MSANSGPLASEADSFSKPSKASCDHLDINKLYKGKTSQTVTETVAQKHGMQAFGKDRDNRTRGGQQQDCGGNKDNRSRDPNAPKPVNELDKQKEKLTEMPHPCKGRFQKPVQLEKLMWKKLYKFKRQHGSAAALQAGWPAAPAEELMEDESVLKELSYSPNRMKVPAPKVVSNVPIRRSVIQRQARSLQPAGASDQMSDSRNSWRWVEIDRGFHRQVLASSILNWKLPHPEEQVVLTETLDKLDVSEIKTSLEPGINEWKWIDDFASFSDMVRNIAGARLLYLDIEYCNQNTYSGFISLIQVTAGGEVYLLDPLALQKELSNEFKDLLESTYRTLIMFGADNDILYLRKHLRIFPNRLLDLQKVDQYLVGGQPRGLVTVLAERLGVQSGQTKQELQRSDWTRRPLSDEQRKYAIHDVKYLPHLLSSYLLEVEADACIQEAFEQSKRTLLRIPRPKKPKSLTQELKHVSGRKVIRFSKDQLELVKDLFVYRGWRAESVDLEPFKVLPMKVLVNIALSPPQSIEALSARLKNLPVLDPVHHLLFQIISDGGIMMQRMLNITCNNCLLAGHVARFCPHPSGIGRPRVMEVQFEYWKKKQEFFRNRVHKRQEYVNSKLKPYCQGWKNKNVNFGLEVNRLEVGDRDAVRYQIKQRCIVTSWGEVEYPKTGKYQQRGSLICCCMFHAKELTKAKTIMSKGTLTCWT